MSLRSLRTWAFCVGAFGCLGGCVAWEASEWATPRKWIALILFGLGWGAMIVAAWVDRSEIDAQP